MATAKRGRVRRQLQPEAVPDLRSDAPSRVSLRKWLTNEWNELDSQLLEGVRNHDLRARRLGGEANRNEAETLRNLHALTRRPIS
jgi:hypothetical protein